MSQCFLYLHIHTKLAIAISNTYRIEKLFIEMSTVDGEYLKLEELGCVLRRLSFDFPGWYICLPLLYFLYALNGIMHAISAAVMTRRTFRDLKTGQPHLLVVPPEQVLRAALSLYMEDTSLPMPTPEEMLICNSHTTAEEVEMVTQF